MKFYKNEKNYSRGIHRNNNRLLKWPNIKISSDFIVGFPNERF